jgi:hypothetical protein
LHQSTQARTLGIAVSLPLGFFLGVAIFSRFDNGNSKKEEKHMERLIVSIAAIFSIFIPSLGCCQSSGDMLPMLPRQGQPTEISNRVENGRHESRETFPADVPPATDGLVVKAAMDIAKIIYGF